MSKQYPGGLITKNPVTPTSLSAPGVWSLSDQAAAQLTNTWPFPRDPQFNYVTMLLHSDGSAAAVPTTGAGAGTFSTTTPFNYDASTNNFNVTINGDARSNNFTPYQGNGYYSNYFGGSGNSLGYPSASQYAIGTGNFTVEFFVNFTTLNAGHNRMFCIGASGTDGLEVDLNGTTLEVGVQNGYPINYTWTPSVGTWYYMAVTRSGTTVTLYINGTSVATGTSSNNIAQNSLNIGGISWQTSWSINGYISNVRLSNTVRTIATPTTPYTTDANTLFLGSQSNRFLDNSGYAATATLTGTPQVAPKQPFTLPSSVATYGSGYFSGTAGGYLETAYNSALDASTGPFTYEAWLNPSTTTNKQYLGGSVTNAFFAFVGSGTIFVGRNNVAVDFTSSALIVTNQWNHVVIVRNSSNNIAIFINGVSAYYNASNTNNYGLASNSLRIGVATTGSSYEYNGYITDVKIAKSALYDPTASTITVPTTPLTAGSAGLLTTQYNGGGDNNGFKDSSQNNFVITRTGSPTGGTFTPYGSNWSNYFGGSGNYLDFPSNAAYGMGTGDFTIDAWVYPTAAWASAGAYNPIFLVNGTGGLYFGQNSAGFGLRQSGTANIISYGTSPTLNTWTHIAIVRSGTTVTMYYNGTSVATATSSANFTSGTLTVGYDGSYAIPAMYISNLRIVKGTAVYTSSFTPSTVPLTAVSGTSLLICQSNRFIDNSSNAAATTITGAPLIQRFSPFAPLTVYNPATTSGSAYFDGASYVTAANSSAFDLSSGDWTIDGWFYLTATPPANGAYIVGNATTATGAGGFGVNLYSTSLYLLGNSNSQGVVSYTWALNTWYHFAVIRSGTGAGSSSIYINGVKQSPTGNGAGNPTFASSSTGPNVGFGITSGSYFPGYLSDIRIVKGSSIYGANPSSITVPTTPTVTTSNTSLLLSSTNAGIFDATMINNLGTVSNAQLSSSVKKFGTASMKFDGDTDYVGFPKSEPFNLYAGNFTIEFWAYWNSFGADKKYVISVTNASNYWQFLHDSTNGVQFIVNSGQIFSQGSNSGWSTGTWYHVALVRNGATLTVYRDGTSVTSGSLGTSALTNYNTFCIGGSAGFPTTTMDGYIDEFRMTRGVARYTANFTPPTQAFPNG